MRLCFFEDAGVNGLEPLVLTRPAFDLWCGAASLGRQQERYFGAPAEGALVRPDLAGLCRHIHPALQVNAPDWLRGEPALLVNARWLPPAGSAPDLDPPRLALAGDEVAYAVVGPDLLAGLAPEGLDE